MVPTSTAHSRVLVVAKKYEKEETLERFSMAVEKPKPKQLPRPITTGANSAMNQSQFLAITCNSLKAREKSRVQGAIGFGFCFSMVEKLAPVF